MKVAMIGAGYVGLTTSACLAELGHETVVFDIASERIAQLRKNHLPIYEPGLDALIRRGTAAGRLLFCNEISAAVGEADAIFLAVGTPTASDGAIDLSQLEAAARSIAPHLKPNAVIVIKSTVAVGTAARIRETVARMRGRMDFHLASNPEFLREGSAIADFMQPDRIVLGCDDPEAGEVLETIYAPLQGRTTLVRTSIANAELSKHAANAFLAVKIGFANEVANLCEVAGADVSAVMDAIGLDARIGRAFMSAGPGYGGSCFPKDTKAFAHSARRLGAPQGVVEAVISGNRDRPVRLAARVVDGARLRRGDHVALLGLAFKANTDDIRESPAIAIANALLRAGMRLKVHDPKAARNARKVLKGDVEWCIDPVEALDGVEACVVATEWSEYAGLRPRDIARAMAGRHVFDYRNLFDPAAMRAAGLHHHSIGRKMVKAEGGHRGKMTEAGALVLPQNAAASQA
jgi:UDPglucose 6-dehydrogenase